MSRVPCPLPWRLGAGALAILLGTFGACSADSEVGALANVADASSTDSPEAPADSATPAADSSDPGSPDAPPPVPDTTLESETNDTTVPDTAEPVDTTLGDTTDTTDTTGPSWACPPPVDVVGAPAGPFSRVGSSIVDSLGRRVALHSVNVSNYTKVAPDRMTWHGPSDFADLAAAGFDSVRLVAQWAGVMPEPYVVDEAYLDALALRVQWAADAGLLVVLDMHQDIFGVGFGDNGAPRWACDEAHYDAYVPLTPWYRNYLSPEVQACFDRLYADDAIFFGLRDAWVAVAARFADHPAVLGFDLLNEPHWGTMEADAFIRDVWQWRQEQIAAAIRGVAPGRIVFFQGTTLVSLGTVQPFAKACDPLVGYAPHYYHPLVHDGYPYAASLYPQVVLAMDAIAASAEALGGAPVWVGEVGIYPQMPSAVAYLHDLLELLAERRWGFSWWSDDKGEGGFALRNEDGTFKTHVVEVLGHPYARRVPGALAKQELDFAVGRYEARFEWTVDAPLEVWRGHDPAAVVAVEAEGGSASVDCAQAPDGPPGVLLCGPPDTLGAPWVLTVE